MSEPFHSFLWGGGGFATDFQEGSWLEVLERWRVWGVGVDGVDKE